MTRLTDYERIEKEARLQEAVSAVQNKEHNVPSAARTFNVPQQTLYDRIKGKPPRNQSHEADQLLSHAEEKELVRWITRLTITGYPPRYQTLREMAEEIRTRRLRNARVNEDGIELVHYDGIGKQWVKRFLNRHRELASVRPRSIDAPRIQGTSLERLQRWFDDVKKVISEYNIKPENMYNMDESGFAIGEKEAGRCIINAEIRQQYQAKPGHQEWVSVIACIGADGSVVPLLVIFQAENLSRQWIPANISGNWRFACNSKGYTSNTHGGEWLTRCFEPETWEKAGGEYRVLICDGHDSHITGKWVAHCMENNILLLILPPHSSHLTQPLDVGIFGPLKKYMAAEIDPLVRLGVSRIQKVEWLAAFAAAHEKAFSTRNILSGFRGTGIHPFWPTRVLDRIASDSESPSLSTETRSATPPMTPFNDTVLTSSPTDFNAIQRANVMLNDMITSGNPMSTPAKKYIKCLTRNVERLHAANSIIQHENEQLKAHAHQRKRKLSGKRKVIDGKHIITATELKGIEEAEKATEERKEKCRKKVQQRRRSRTRKESTDESEMSPDSSEDEAGVILDCIEVAL